MLQKNSPLHFSYESSNFQKQLSLKHDTLQMDYPVLPHQQLALNASDRRVLHQKTTRKSNYSFDP